MTEPIVTEKFCRNCRTLKPASDFHKNAGGKYGLEARCKTCRLAPMKTYRQTYKARHNEKQRAWHATSRAGQNRVYVAGQKKQIKDELIRRVGQQPPYVPAPITTLDEYERMLAEQGGVCAICKRPQHNIRLSIDHCHVTGKIRGLLCINCNHGLGNFKDNPQLLEAARQFLIAHGR